MYSPTSSASGMTVLPLGTILRMTACPMNERLQTGMD
jgi:hypothetical protein